MTLTLSYFLDPEGSYRNITLLSGEERERSLGFLEAPGYGCFPRESPQTPSSVSCVSSQQTWLLEGNHTPALDRWFLSLRKACKPVEQEAL